MNKINLKVQGKAFDAIYLKSANPSRRVIFATGAGGNPERHLSLLQSLSDCGCDVIAPHFERITSVVATADELNLRVRILQVALDFLGSSNSRIVGIGHSIGATLLTGLAGGQMWLKSGQRLAVAKDDRFQKLVLFAPATGYFLAPDALAGLNVQMQLWTGAKDTITPVQQIQIFEKSLPDRVCCDFRVIEGAGHFSFMNILPPNIEDSLNLRDEFLKILSVEVCNFVV